MSFLVRTMWYSFYKKQNPVPSQSKGFIACLPLVHWSWCNCAIRACLFCYLNWHILVPEKINWEDHVRKNSVDWDWQMAVCKLFDERPVWPRQSLYERLLDDSVHVSQSQFKRLLFRAGYYFSTGPFGKFWIRRGYDPRKDSESRIYQRIDFRMPPELRYLLRPKNSGSQKWADMCKQCHHRVSSSCNYMNWRMTLFKQKFENLLINQFVHVLQVGFLSQWSKPWGCKWA